MVRIAPAAPGDDEALAALARECFDRVADFAAERGRPERVVLVARAGGRVVGYAAVQVVADEAELHELAVRGESRRAGVGRRLLQRALAEASARGAAAMYLEVAADNAAGVRLYEAGGFGVEGVRVRYYPSGADALLMRRALTTHPG